jgi:hypothetical protein
MSIGLVLDTVSTGLRMDGSDGMLYVRSIGMLDNGILLLGCVSAAYA